MTAVLRKVRPGDPLEIPAQTFNTMIDVARDFQQRQRRIRRDMHPDVRQTGIVLVRNDSGAERQRFDVLGISGPIINPTIADPDDNVDAFVERVALSGALPASTHVGRFALLLESVPDGEIGRACLDGLCLARVEMLDEAHTFADVKVGDAAVLQSRALGGAQLLWVQPQGDRTDPEIAWTVVRLGLGSGGATSGSFAMITSKSGASPPYRYAAAEATMDVDGNWSQVGGGAAYNNVFNVEEQGAGGQWVNPLIVGDVVLIYAAPDPAVDAFVCTRSHYRGTY